MRGRVGPDGTEAEVEAEVLQVTEIHTFIKYLHIIYMREENVCWLYKYIARVFVEP